MLSRLALLAALLVASAQVPGDRAKKRNEPGPEANIPQCSVPTTRTAGIEPNAPAPEKKPDRLHKALGPETGSNWALVVGAIWAGFVATRTLNSLESQVAEPNCFQTVPSTCAIACWTSAGHSHPRSSIHFCGILERSLIRGERPIAVEGSTSLGASEIPSNTLSPGQSPLA
jgi:hypothetical protein